MSSIPSLCDLNCLVVELEIQCIIKIRVLHCFLTEEENIDKRYRAVFLV